MATVARTTNTRGYIPFSITTANDETEQIAVNAGDTMTISATGMSGSTAQILWRSSPNATGIPLSFEGSTSFTSDFAYNFEAGGKGFVSVKMTVDGGTISVVFTK